MYSLSVCVQKFGREQIDAIVDKLGSLIINPQKENDMRDMYSIGLKTLILALPDEQGDTPAALIASAMIKGLRLALEKK